MIEAAIRSLFRTELILPCIGVPRKLSRGYSHENWLVDSGAGDKYLVKIAKFCKNGDQLTNSALAADLALKAGLKTPKFIYINRSHSDFSSRPVGVCEFLGNSDGEALEKRGCLSDAFVFAWGQDVARLHSVQGPSFCRNVHGTGDTKRWSEFLEGLSGRLEKRFKENDELRRYPCTEVMGRVIALAKCVNDVVEARLVHDDLYLANVITKNEEYLGLIDFEHARFWDQVGDFVKLKFLVFESYPELYPKFLQGYESVSSLPRSFDERLRIAIAIELLSAIPFLSKIGALQMLRDYERRLNEWTTQ